MKAKAILEVITKDELLKMMAPTTIWTALVTTGFAEDYEIFAAHSKAAVVREVAHYVREAWEELGAPGPLPPQDDAAVKTYFAAREDDDVHFDEHQVNVENETAIWTAVIRHRFGFDVYADNSKDGVLEKVAEYCAEYWDNVAEVEGEAPPQDLAERVHAYFARQQKADPETLSIDEHPL